jgi:methyl-accepting chemotaxis protein
MKNLKIGPKIFLAQGVIAVVQAGVQWYIGYSDDHPWGQHFAHLMAVIVTTLIMVQILVHKMIVVPLRKLTELSRDITKGEGDLTKRVPVAGHDEIGDFGQSFNMFIDKLQLSILTLGEVTNRVATASSDLSHSAEEIAHGAETQTSRMTQAAYAVEEMTRTAGEVAQNSQRAASIAQQATETAQAGYCVVSETISGMQEVSTSVGHSATIIAALGQSSDQIGEIVRVIEEIADQTNLLALNAAIEAARAGDQGRGFAVVADEVRKLAERTTKATKEIGDMIRQIQQNTKQAVGSMQDGTAKVIDGVEQARKTGEALTKIQEMVTQSAEMIQQIAFAAEEQSTATHQIASDLETVTQVSQDTSNSASGSAQSSRNLNGLSSELQAIVNSFKV